MGMMDMAKMAAKAMQARKKMSKIQAVGQSGSVGIIINGVYSIVDIEVDNEVLASKVNLNKSGEEIVKEVSNILKKDIKDALEDSKKQLEKEMASGASLDDLKDLLQN